MSIPHSVGEKRVEKLSPLPSFIIGFMCLEIIANTHSEHRLIQVFDNVVFQI